MAGHSHSANIKYRKDRQGAKKGVNFMKLAKKLEKMIKEGSGLEKALSIAREANFPKEKVERIWEKHLTEKTKK